MNNELHAVSVLSPCDAWAVGFDLGNTDQTLTEHWDGASWTVVPSPNPGANGDVLDGVLALSAHNVWAVGSFDDSAQHTLIEHWDGSSWKVLPSPSPGGVVNELHAVRGVSANDIWAVGDTSDGTGHQPLLLHWTGASWRQATSQNPGGPADDVRLFGVSATSARDAWAVGNIFGDAGDRSFVLHWNGSAWATVTSPHPGTGNDLFAVSATSAADAWAVGFAGNGTTNQTFILRWNGHRWAHVTSPDPAGQGNENILNGVFATSAGNAWAVGRFVSGNQARTLILHWNGTRWVHVPSPDTAVNDDLFAVAAKADGDAWAVGTSAGNGGPGHALALHCC